MIKKYINEETILYIIFGIITSLLNILLFSLLNYIGINYLISNIITLIIVKIVAYICNKMFVFKSRCNNFKELVLEFIRFFFSRFITLLIDYFGLIIFIELFGIDKTISKIIITVIVVVINYFFGKKYVFKNSMN